jgi:protein-S-isoprenylcysteine O-methyltransferase Ste14
VKGAFRLHRHPANWGFVPFFLLFPKMTVNRAMLGILATVYLLLGSVHEEYRLKQAYGAAYERYRRQVPFLLPAWRSSR